ncbi:MAG: GlxA family transcriptional regulator [Alphaproteobacteria bacterium]
MLKCSSTSDNVHLTILLVPNFSLMAFSSIIEPLRLANRIVKNNVYTWEIVSKDGNPEKSSSNTEVIVNNRIANIDNPDNVIICSGINGNLYKDAFVFGHLRRWEAEGSYIGACCTGGSILANAGLLNGHKATLHWENMASFKEQHPDIEISADLFVSDGNIFTSAGGTTTIDMMLEEIKERLGKEVAITVADLLVHERIRGSKDNQRIPLQNRINTNNSKIIQAIEIMEQNIDPILPRNEIASAINISPRQMERLFKKHLNMSPAKYYLHIRLKHAKYLLEQTSMPISEISLATGFSSASHFSKCFGDLFNTSPKNSRESA